MPIDPFIIIICILVSVLLIGVGFAISVFRYIKRYFYIKNFETYVSVLEYSMKKAYELLYKDRMLAYSLEAYRVPENEYESISQEFVRLVQKYIGPTMLKEFIQLYGNEDTFIFIVLEYFSSTYEEDEIRKSALDNLTQEEQV